MATRGAGEGPCQPGVTEGIREFWLQGKSEGAHATHPPLITMQETLMKDGNELIDLGGCLISLSRFLFY